MLSADLALRLLDDNIIELQPLPQQRVPQMAEVTVIVRSWFHFIVLFD